MNAVILAGGFGSRLSPITDNLAKPMLSVANAPMIDYSVSHLFNSGVKDFVFTLNYKPQDIIEWCIGYKGVTSRFSLESEPLGTLGGVKAVEDYLHDVFIVCSGDCIADVDFKSMINTHLNSNASVTMAVAHASDASCFGVPTIDDTGRITGFVEKPQTRGNGCLVNTGIYIINKSILSIVPKYTKIDFANDLFPTLAFKGELQAFVHDGYWQDAGTLDRYYSANFDIKNSNLIKPAPNMHRIQCTTHSAQCTIDDDNLGLDAEQQKNSPPKEGWQAQPDGVGKNSLIATTAQINGNIQNCIIGDKAYVENSANLTNCIVLKGAKAVGTQNGTIIGKGYNLAVKPQTHDYFAQDLSQGENYYS